MDNNEKKKETAIPTDKAKRTHLKWIAPAVVAVTLPTHAQATPMPTTPEPAQCSSSPTITGNLIPCKDTDSPEGERIYTILSDNEDMEILAIDSNVSAGDTLTIPSLPATVTTSSGVEVVWTGPVVDAIDCQPATSVTITVTYNCNSDASGPFTADFDLAAAL